MHPTVQEDGRYGYLEYGFPSDRDMRHSARACSGLELEPERFKLRLLRNQTSTDQSTDMFMQMPCNVPCSRNICVGCVWKVIRINSSDLLQQAVPLSIHIVDLSKKSGS